MSNKNKTVYIGLSGGVDSAVSAAVLRDGGYNVIAVFIKTWAPDGYPCPTEDDKRESMRVAAHLRIPWIEVDGEDAYKKHVATYMLNEYAAGRTPNPDVFCNTTVKFGVFYEMAMAKNADFIATGHYAQMLEKNGNMEMHAGVDVSKDQTYFLWNVPHAKLIKTMFPIGNIPKTKVRELAKKYKLPNAERPDSQGVCFLGPIDMKAFIIEQLKPEKGNVLNTEGKIIGEHDGAIIYTLGERHGFRVSAHEKPLFIVDKDAENNTITVSENPKDEKFTKDLYINSENWLPERPGDNEVIDAVFRYHGERYPAVLSKDNKIVFQKEHITAAAGQSVVFYRGTQCLGGGIISYN